MTQNGSDVIDTGIDFSQGQKVTDVDVVLSSQVTTLNGAVQDSRQKPVTPPERLEEPVDALDDCFLGRRQLGTERLGRLGR